MEANNIKVKTNGSLKKSEKIKKYLRQMKAQWSETQECSKSSFKREVYINTTLPQEIRKISNKDLILHLKQLKKQTKT